MDAITVEQPAQARLVTAEDQEIPVSATLRYTTDDPLAVFVDFPAEAALDGEEVTWVFARSLLDQGLRSPAGHGDVQIWSSTRPTAWRCCSSPRRPCAVSCCARTGWWPPGRRTWPEWWSGGWAPCSAGYEAGPRATLTLVHLRLTAPAWPPTAAEGTLARGVPQGHRR